MGLEQHLVASAPGNLCILDRNLSMPLLSTLHFKQAGQEPVGLSPHCRRLPLALSL